MSQQPDETLNEQPDETPETDAPGKTTEVQTETKVTSTEPEPGGNEN